MQRSRLERLAAFTDNPAHGNPAGVWRGDALPAARDMQDIAAEVGYSETIFLAPLGDRRFRVRYFSPAAEVSFCGHATIAAGVTLGQHDGPGRYSFETSAGDVVVEVRERGNGVEALLTSVEPRYEPAAKKLVDAALTSLGWRRADLDGAIAPARVYAGAWHLVLAAATRSRLRRLEYDFDALKALMIEDGLTTLQLVYRESASLFNARNPFPVGGVVEDPATGAAAAALGGYLRDSGIVSPPATLTIRQGEDMGRASRISVGIPEQGGIVVSGTAVVIDR